MTLSDLSIKKPVFAWMLMAALLVFGWLSFQRMGISQMPDVDFPVVNISAGLEGAAPEVMELNVVEPIEEALMSVQGIKSLSSTSRSGRANITVEFDLKKDLDIAVQEIQTVLSQLQRRLPKDLDPPVVSKSNPEDQPILWTAVGSDRMSRRDLMAYVREHIKDKFSTVSGVAEIILGGYVDPSLNVMVNSQALEKYSLSVGDVVQAIQSEHAELPAGRLENATHETNIRTMGEAKDPAEFGNISINRRGGAPNFVPIRLKDVASIEEGLADVRRKSRSMGKPSIGLGIKKQRGTNAVDVARAIKAQLEVVRKQLPEGMDIAVTFDSTRFIEEAVHELNFTLVLSCVLTALVCWMFLGSFSATLNVIFAIPVSVIGSFIALYALNFTLNTFTLLGLSLAIGIVVDDAIMVLENIVRHMEMGKKRMEASLVGAREITFAAIAATAAVMAIFLPVAFMEGLIGKYFYQFGVTLSVAVAVSLLEALTLAPMRCSQFLEVGDRKSRIGRLVDAGFIYSEKAYTVILTWCLGHRWTTIAITFGVFALSVLSVIKLKKEFVPAQDQSTLMLRVQAPIGSSIEFTDQRFEEIEAVLKKRGEVLRYFSAIGGFGGGEVDTGIVFLTLKQPQERPIDSKKGRRLTQQELADELRAELKQIKNVKAFVMDLSQQGFSAKRGFPVEYTVRGPDWSTLIDSSQKLMAEMNKTGLMTDVDSDYRAGMPELQIIPDREKARIRGVSVYDISQTINAMIGGVIVAKYSRGNFRYDVRVRMQASERTNMDVMKRLLVRNNRGELIPVRDLVRVSEEQSLQAIHHQDRERAISVFANVATGVSQQNAIEAVQNAAKTVLPQGYQAIPGGSTQTFQESFKQLIFALILGLVVAYMILGAQFNSFLDPFIVLLALPFSLSGAFVALLLTGLSLNVFSMIGIVLLMGIVKKNSILLVDFTNQERTAGRGIRDSLMAACPMRLRPILMTSTSTIVGAIPPAMAIGPGAESRVPMAIAVIGGMLLSTLLTLVVVPCAYSLLNPERPKKRSVSELELKTG